MKSQGSFILQSLCSACHLIKLIKPWSVNEYIAQSFPTLRETELRRQCFDVGWY